MDPKTTKVLLIDDDPNLRGVLSDILKEKGYESVPVKSGAAALAQIEQQDIDVVLIDIKLEDMSGLEVLRSIKARSPEIECIMLTGHASQATAIEAVNLGAYSYFQKPYEVDQLLVAIRRAAEKHAAEHALQESEARFRSIIENSSDLICILNPDATLRYVSPSIERLLGYTSEDIVIGTGLQDYIHPDDLTAFMETFRQHIQTSDFSPVSMHLRVRHKDGTWHTLEGTGSSLLENPAIAGIIINARDVTERTRAEEARHEAEIRYRSLFEQSHDAIFIMDLESRHLDANLRAAQMLGYTRDEILKLSVADTSAQLQESHQVLERLLAGEHIPLYERIFRKKNGDLVPVEINVELVRDAGGHPLHIQSVVRDVTDRKRAEEALAASEAELRALFASMQDVVLVIDRLGKYLKIAPTNPGLLAKPPEELLGKTLRDVFPPELAGTFIRVVEQVLDTKQSTHIEYDLNIGDRKVWFETSISPMTEDSTLWVARDISARKQAEESLRESEERYRQLVERTPNGVLIHVDGMIVFANSAGAKLLGPAAPEALVGKRLLDFVHPDYRKIVRGRVEQLTGSKTEVPLIEEKLIRLDGTVIDAEVTAIPFIYKNRNGVQVVFNDITERRRSEEALRESENLLRTIVDGTQALLVNVDVNGHFTYANDATAKAVGYASPAELIGKPYLHFIYPEDRQQVLDTFSNQISMRKPFSNQEFRIVDTQGKIKWFSFLATLAIEDGQVVGQSGVALDINERRRAEEALRLRESYLTAILENQPGLVWLKDVDNRFLTVNQAFADSSGKASPAELAGKTDFDIWPRELAEKYGADDAGIIKNKAPIVVEEIIFDRGKTTWFETFKTPILNDKGDVIGTTGYSRDITERKRAEEEIRRRLGELESLSQVSISLTSAIDLPPLLENILVSARNAIPAAEKGTILLMEPNGALRLHAMSGYSEPRLMSLALPDQSGYAARVATERTPIKIDDAHAGYEIPYKGMIEEIDTVQSGIAAPLIAKGKVIGVISLDNASRKAAFTESDLSLLVTFASSAAVAIENARLFTETQQRLHRLSALHSIDAAIGASVDTHVTLSIVLEHAITELKADAAAVLLFNPLTMMLEYAAGRGFRVHSLEGLRLRLGEGLAGQSALQRRAINITDLQQGDEVEQTKENSVSGSAPRPLQYLEGEKFVSYHAIPLIAKGQIQGVLEIFKRTPMQVDQEWITFAEMLAGQTAIAIDNGRLFENLQHSNLELTLAYDATIQGWSQALELRDEETEGHTLRVTDLTLRLIQAMGVEEVETEHARRGSLLHDIGKMAIPDSILLKAGPLDEREWKVMRQHPQYAYNLLFPIAYLRPAILIPYCHHEKWDGSGYPRGLKGEEIPLVARIFAIVDVFDALTSNRPYRLAWTREDALEFIREQSGRHFDPTVVKAFMGLMVGGS